MGAKLSENTDLSLIMVLEGKDLDIAYDENKQNVVKEEKDVPYLKLKKQFYFAGMEK